MSIRFVPASFLALPLLFADVRGCKCDPLEPVAWQARECGLCRETDKQPAEPQFFFLKDINPRKPNRWLMLPRFHLKAGHELADMTPAQRTAYWTAAIEKGKELFGDKWGLAINGDESRTQCHAHIHIGRLLEGVETGKVLTVDGPAQIPLSKDGSGFWVHPVGNKLHVHVGEWITETVLIR